MKARIFAIGVCIAVLVWFSLPYVSDQEKHKSLLLHAEPVYNGRPLHEWVVDIQDENPDFSPSALAMDAAKAVQAVGPAAIPWLIKWIKPPVTDPRLPDGAIESFKILGARAEAAVPELIMILNAPPKTIDDFSSQSEAAEALSYLGPKTIPALLAVATNFSGHIQSEIIQNFGNMGTNGIVVIPALITWSHDKDDSIRLAAVIALGQMAMKPEIVIPALRDSLNDSNALVRNYAGEGLGNFGKQASSAVSDLIKLLDDKDAQAGAIIALARITDQRDWILPVFAKKMHDDDWTVRRVTAYALGDLGGQAAFDTLMQATDDPNDFVREAVFQSLKKIDPQQLEKSGKRFSATDQSKPDQN